MKPDQRRQAILAWARRSGRVEVSDLGDELGVAQETVRRDLGVLAAQGLLRRVRGGAFPVETAAFESGMSYRSQTNVAQKRRIASEAVARVGEAETVFVDEGFTPQLVATDLAALERPLTVVTASLSAAAALAECSWVTTILLGGRIRHRTLGAVGAVTTTQLGGLVVDLAYLGANGVSRQYGLTTPDPAVAAVKAQAMASARRHIFIGTYAKFGVSSLHRFAEVRDFEVLVTDTGLSASEAQRYVALGTDVVRV
ncbi:transcriptional regulator [Pseudonocardia sp. TMWB2A]|uniref:DeoR/GlpR family DNA-binding transcription regulator n=1 Tax=Pseudonocardia sp. TMWB2A TaxID=687430 RepID=UPI00307D978D